MKSSLQRKILYSIMAVIIVVLVGVSVGISVQIREYYLINKQQDLQNKGYELSRVVNSYYDGEISYNQLGSFVNSVDSFLDARVWVLDGSRNLLVMSAPRHGMGIHGLGTGRGLRPGQPIGNGSSERLRSVTSLLDTVYAGNVFTKTFYHPFYEEDMLLVVIPLLRSDDTIEGAVMLNAPIKGINDVLWRIYFYIATAGLIGLLLAFFIARQLARGIVKPLQAMQETAGAMSRGDYNSRVQVKTNDEVGELGKSLNTLAQDLGAFVNQTAQTEKLRRDFIANVSHELRTPLTIIRGYNEAFLDGTIEGPTLADKYHLLMRDETERLERLIHDLLDLSRLQADNNVFDMEPIPLSAVVDSVTTMLRQQAERKQVKISLQMAPQAPDILGNGDRLTQLILILLDNALKYTPEGGEITVTISFESGRVLLKVADTGVGIPSEDLPFIWERFYKVDKAHSRSEVGTGLGLSIAKEIIDKHDAKVLVTSEIGKGTEFNIYFAAG